LTVATQVAAVKLPRTEEILITGYTSVKTTAPHKKAGLGEAGFGLPCQVKQSLVIVVLTPESLILAAGCYRPDSLAATSSIC
jgi:hypothetical protein